MMRIASAFFVCAAILTRGAEANVAEYCSAFARDIADASATKGPVWQGRFDSAEKSCLQRFTPVERPVEKILAVKKPKAKPPTPAPKPKPKEIAEKPVPEPEKQAAKVVGRPKEGTKEWLDYCTKKYASFDEATKTYTSKTGVKRKCLVNSVTP